MQLSWLLRTVWWLREMRGEKRRLTFLRYVAHRHSICRDCGFQLHTP